MSAKFNKPPAEFSRDEALEFLRSPAAAPWCEAAAVLIAEGLDRSLDDPKREGPSIADGMRWSVEAPPVDASEAEHEAWLDRKPGGRPAWTRNPDNTDYQSRF